MTSEATQQENTTRDDRAAAPNAVRRRSFRERREPVPDSPIIDAVLGTAAFQEGIARLARTLGRSEATVLDEATADLRGMSATHDQTVTAWWERLGTWMLRGFDLIIDEESLARLRELDRSYSLVFLIAHKSYLDEWIVPPTLPRYGLSAPFGLAGANLDFFPLGTIARRTGIVHIRRATHDLPIYKFALRSFMGQLITQHANLIWSIEGGRSRTGKLRPPRFGLLRYVADAVERPDSPEALLVPVSIVYDQLPRREVQLMTSEAKGQGKTPEDVRWFAGYLRGLAARLGRVYLDFGEPLPLQARLRELREEHAPDTTAIERIAVEVCHRINLATPVTPTAVVTIALLGADRALTLDQIVDTVEPMATYLRARHWPTAGGATLSDRATLRRALTDLVESGVLQSYTAETTVWGIAPGEELAAAMYRNTAVHVLVNRAIAEVVLSRIADGVRPGEDTAFADALALRDLLKFDFFFESRDEFATSLRTELGLMDDEGRTATHPSAADARQYLERGRPLVAHLVLRPFVESYWILASALAARGDEPVTDQDGFVDECRRLGRQWVLQRRVASAESVSGELFGAGLRLAEHRGLLMPSDGAVETLGHERQIFLDEIAEVRRSLYVIAGHAYGRSDP